MYSELKEVLDLTKVIYANNYTTESNYLYFHASGAMWTSNAVNKLTGDDALLIHKFKTPIFKNIGIPAKDLHDVLSKIKGEITIVQEEDHIVISSEKVNIKLKTLDYKSCPLKTSIDKEFVENVPTFNMKPLLEFMDKNEENSRKVHFGNNMIYTTDVVSIHCEAVVSEFNFSISPNIVELFENFEYLCIEDYLYLKSSGGTVLVTGVTKPSDISFLDMEREEVLSPIKTFAIENADLLKIFNADVKKPDRYLHIEISGGSLVATVDDNRKGSASVTLCTGVEGDIQFKVNVDKFVSVLKNFDTFSIEDDILIAVKDEAVKYVQVEVL